MRLLGADVHDHAGACLTQRRADSIREWKNRLDTAVAGYNDQKCKPCVGNILLVFQVAVHGDKGLEASSGTASQKLAVLDARLPDLNHSFDIVAAKLGSELARH